MFHEWTLELKAMADRIISMRQQLFDALRARGKYIIFAWWCLGLPFFILLPIAFCFLRILAFCLVHLEWL